MSPTLLVTLLTAAPAWAWPAEADWAALTQGGVEIVDPTLDAAGAPQRVDLVGSGTDAALYWWTDGVDLFLRMRLNADPGSSPQPLNTDNFGFLIDTDGDRTDYELSVLTWAQGSTLQIHGNAGGIGWTDSPAPTASTVYASPFNAEQYARISASGAGTAGASGDEDWFLDLRVAWADLAAAGGIDAMTGLSIAAATEFDNATSFSFSTDLAGGDNGGSVTLDDGLSDTVYVDRDGDGLTDFEEADLGTDPELEDTDGDGVSDADELADGTDPTEADTDGDGLTDGEEADLGTDPTEEDSDGDGATDGEEVEGGTDPMEEDSDGDGILDGDELDCGGDDADDRDGDGIPDADELALGDSDEDGDADWCDDDDDGDGIPTSTEGTIDTDEDGDPDYLDLDSDDDEASDREEGVEDQDCDGTPNYVDAEDEDGPCGDPDQDGLTNAEEEDCGTDPNDPDTDGDGILDGDESCEDDSDGDGVVDALDDTDDDGDGGGLDPVAGGLSGFTGGDFTGGSCSSLPGAALLGPALLAALAAGRRRRRRSSPAGLVATGAAATLASPALAQELNADRLRPSIGQDTLLVTDDSEVGAPGPGGTLLFAYADDPLVYRFDDGREEIPILERVGTLRAMPWWAFGPARIGLDLPFHLATEGYGLDEVSGKALGDIGVDGRVRLLDRTDGGLGLAGQARLDLPTGAGRAWLGEPGAGVHVQANATWGQDIVLAANLGARLGARDTLDTLQVGNVLTFGAGGWVPVGERLGGSLELFGERYLGSPDAAGNTRLEWLADTRFAATEQLSVNLGGGTGLSRGAGAPDFRVLAGVTWVPRAEERAPAPTTSAAKDASIVNDKAPGARLARLHFVTDDGASLSQVQLTLDEGPEVGRYASPDGGRMGLWLQPGSYQATVEVPGYLPVSLGFVVPPDHGVDKRIQLTASARSCGLAFEITDLDRTPVAARIRSLDGSVDLQADPSTGVATTTLAEGTNLELVVGAPGHSSDHRAVSCTPGADGRLPDLALSITLPAPRARVDGARIRIEDKIHFELDSTTIRPASRGVLDDVAAVLAANPKLGRVEIQGHTDVQGDAEHNLQLSQARAEAVRDYLVSRGVDAGRLVARGLGESQPVRMGSGPDDHEANRRVEFHIQAQRPQ
jgi:outer membrane protein OmpA-like peptidoglycan-associated protein